METSCSPGDAYHGLTGGEAHYFSIVLCFLIKKSPRRLLSHMLLTPGPVHTHHHHHFQQVGGLTHRRLESKAHNPNRDPVGKAHCGCSSRMCSSLPVCWLKNSSLSALTSMRKVAGKNSSIFSLLQRARMERGRSLELPCCVHNTNSSAGAAVNVWWFNFCI